MFSLIFYRNDQAVFRHDLKGDQISIGRDAANDAQLVDDDISRVHAVLSWQNGGFVIFDKSTNGTFVNDRKIDSHKLEPGDNIKMGEWKISFGKGKDESSRKTVAKDSSPTKILKYETGKKELLFETIELTVIPPKGPKKNFRVATARIGADPNNDIVVTTDPYLSSKHCAIRNTDDGFVLEDTGSTNGTFIGEKKISVAVLPKKGIFTAGKTVIKFAVKRQSEKIRPTAVTSMGEMIGRSPAMREMFALLERIAPSDATICVVGGSGTGKELVARYIHEASPRCTKPFVALNCGAIPANLIESELFGHEKGAFTSATAQHGGVFEQADGGTLFLDEIGEMPVDLQTRLLRVLETKEIRRVGGQADVPINVRVITATNRDLKKLAATGHFREDLFYRLYVVPVVLPLLRERKEDIPLLAEHFLNGFAVEGNKKRLSSAAVKKLSSHDWPGNVRELKNVIQRALLIAPADEIKADDIVFAVAEKGVPENATLNERERASVTEALKKAGGNASKAARNLGIARTTINSMIKRFGIDMENLRK